jgi:DNA replication factor GINS
MYNDLYEIWKRELGSSKLERLPPDFYARITDYLRKISEESRMLDKRTLKATFLKKETQNVERMIRELIHVRYKKLVKALAQGKKAPSDALTAEEEKIYARASSFADAFQSFSKDILRGYLPPVAISEQKNTRTALRFLKDIPSIIGSDMKTYGPFKPEDVASLPIENAKILVKQGLAQKIEPN